MSSSPHKVRFPEPLKSVRVRSGFETLVAANRLEEMLEARFQAGIEAGKKSLSEQLVEQRKQLLEIQSGVLRSMEQALPKLISESEQALVLLALEAARRVVGALPVTPEMVENTVRQALAELKQAAEYQVLLHPEDLAMLEAIQSGLLPSAETAVRFTADPAVARGGCVVRTRHGSIEAVRSKMFEKLERAVLC